MVILGHLLDPAAKVIDKAITPWEKTGKFPTVDRERIADYIAHAIERSVLGLSKSPMDLQALVRASSPFAWSDRFAAACVQSGVTAVRRARTHEVAADVALIAETLPAPTSSSVTWTDRSLSAEELFLQQERRSVIHNLEDTVESWGTRNLTAVERDVERAQAARTLIGVPAACVADDTHKRWLSTFVKTDGAQEQLRLALVAHRDLAGGDPQWAQLAVDDRLLDLWMDYTAEQATTLLAAPAEAVLAIAVEAAAYPARPREGKRVAVRRMLKDLTIYRGWPSTVMRLERAWVAEFFDAHCEGAVASAGFDAEEARAADAADWPAAAQAALTFPGRPFGPSVTSVDDIAQWIMRAYRMATQPQAAAEKVAA